MSQATRSVLDELEGERAAQDDKWGEQNFPNGTDETFDVLAVNARKTCQQRAAKGRCTWYHVLAEEYYEALAETDDERLRAELVQLAAVVVQWIECIDRRKAGSG